MGLAMWAPTARDGPARRITNANDLADKSGPHAHLRFRRWTLADV
jgi:hypothetical protein